MDLQKIKKVHCIGAGGIGVSAIAKFFLRHQKEVSGSDTCPTEITKELEKKGIKIFTGHQESNLATDADLVIFSPAVPESNPERQKATKLKIKQLSYPQFLGELSRTHRTIAVSGTNGKSTTTAMLGKIFTRAGLDPTVIVGTKVPGFDGNLRMGRSDILIVEACEWKAHMLELSPLAIVITNLELDHTDFYKDLDDLKKYFQRFINSLPEEGLLAFNADDSNLVDLEKNKGFQVESWSLKDKADFNLKIPGDYNVLNALAAVTVARHFHIAEKVINQALNEFPGCWRRFETLGPIKNMPSTLVISDYAHHPAAIRGLLKATRQSYPNRRLFAVFQPHHYDRTAKLFDEFVKSFVDFDLLVVNEVYDAVGRQQDGQRDIGSLKLVEEIKKFNFGKEIIYSPNLSQTKKIVLEKAETGDIVLIIGAGDIDDVARDLTN